MDASGPGTKPVEHETESTAKRTTRGGRKLLYRLTVIQQPLRARACGSGAKSSADRRPVDPPPIVQLGVFDETDGEPRDITYSMNANYFLFATLEQARVIAPGRIGDDSRNLTVLTGTPVAGMVLLDRPKPAGYFIFPDLSVRHEGKYRLGFSLYEELKNTTDEDQTDDLNKPPGDAHVTHRLEVKSVPFTVFSAKKFPGLTESTYLSRMVAEQGCRVRIRRDVRMRRRDTKGAKEWDGYEDETAEQRARMTATPEMASYQGLPPPQYMDPISRPRSSSNVSHHSLAPSMSLGRRTSVQDINSAYAQPGYGTAPHTPQTGYNQTSPYGPSPGHYAPPAYVQQQSGMQPPPPQYQQPTYQQPQALPPSAPPQTGYYPYGHSAAPPQPQVAPGAQAYDTQERQYRSSIDHAAPMANDMRRSSVGYGQPPPAPPQSTYAPRYSYGSEMGSQSSYQPAPPAAYSSQHSHQPSYSSSDPYSNRAGPPEPVQPPTRPSIDTPPISRPFGHQTLPPLNTLSVMNNKQVEPSSPSPAGMHNSYSYPAVQTPQDANNKRGFGQVFSDRHQHQPLRQGARPSDAGHFDMNQTYYGAEVEGDADPNQLKMTYKRSDGTTVERVMPTGAAC